MKQLLQKLGFRKADEMERYILFRAQRNGYLFLTLSLLVWSFYESWRVYAYHSRLNLVPGLLLGLSVAVQGFTQLWLTHRAVKDDEEAMETAPLYQLILLVCLVVGLLIAAGGAFLILGARL